MSISYLPLGNAHVSRNFRLLKISPGEEGSILDCAMKHFSINRAPPYRAISYTWGSPFATGERNDAAELEPIIVDGKTIYVSQSVSSALKAMRDWHPAETDWVWADAICIDQTNIPERGQQVVLMSQIYSQAESAFVWLGPSTDDSDIAIGLLKDLAGDRRQAYSRAAILGRAADHEQKYRWQALATFMARRWWTRAWILQESVLARTLDFACGKTSVPGDVMLDGFDATEDYKDKVYNLLSTLHGITLNVHSGNVINGMSRMRAARLLGTVYSMPTCHFRSMSAQATDPRDYVYAKLGLAADGHFVEPDYTKGLTETYRDFVAGYIKSTRALDIIYFDARPRETPDLPSWVPDWNASFGAQHLVPERTVSISTGVPLLKQEHLDNQAKDAVASFDFETDGLNRMIVSACFFDTVDGVGKAGEVGWQGAVDNRPMSQAKSSQSAYDGDEATFDAVWRTLVANKGYADKDMIPSAGGILAAATTPANVADPKTGPRFTDYWSNVKDLKVAKKTIEEWMAWGRETLPAPPPFTAEEQVEVESSFVDVCYFRRFLTTERGYTGVASCETEPGDQVCVLKGSRLPVILRRSKKEGEEAPADPSEGTWVLVGHGYVHGIEELAESVGFVNASIV